MYIKIKNMFSIGYFVYIIIYTNIKEFSKSKKAGLFLP